MSARVLGAVKDYQHVADTYAGTLSAQKAAVALAAPVSFTVTIADFPAKYTGYVGQSSLLVFIPKN